MADLNQNQDYRAAYSASVVEDADELELELAGPWQRIFARILDGVPFVVLGIVAALALPYFKGNDTAVTVLMVAVLLAVVGFVIYQLVIMTRHGQSIGKKLLGIRVVTAEGDNPGFVRYVLKREFLYNIILSLVSFIPFVGPLVNWGATLACVVMLFLVERNRRTLQDMLADTLVVKV